MVKVNRIRMSCFLLCVIMYNSLIVKQQQREHMNKIAHYSLHKLDFFELDITKVCDLTTSDLLCVCNSMRCTDILNTIVKHELKPVDNVRRSTYHITEKDIYLTSLKFIVEMYYGSIDDEDDEEHNLYKQAYDFMMNNNIIAVYGVDADETGTYIVVVEYT